MRITNSMMVSGYLKNLNKNSEKLDKLQNQLSSGKYLQRASDDPARASKVMQLKSSLQKVEQYSNNVNEASDWLTQSESSLSDMNSMLKRAYELTVNAANGTNGPDEREAIGKEIEQINQQLVVTGNATFNGRYIFGGTNTSKPPFEVKSDGLYYNNVSLSDTSDADNAANLASLSGQRINYELGFGAKMDVSYNGIDIFGSGQTNMFSVLDNLKTALNNNDAEAIKNAVGSVQSLHENVVSFMGELGGKTNRLEFFTSRIENEDFNLKSMLSDAEDIDMETVIMNMKMQEATYEAALAAGSKIITKTLADFLS